MKDEDVIIQCRWFNTHRYNLPKILPLEIQCYIYQGDPRAPADTMDLMLEKASQKQEWFVILNKYKNKEKYL